MSKVIKQILQEEEDGEKAELDSIRLRLVESNATPPAESGLGPELTIEMPEPDSYPSTAMPEPEPALEKPVIEELVHPAPSVDAPAVSEPELPTNFDRPLRELLRTKRDLFQKKPKPPKQKTEPCFERLEAQLDGVKRRSHAPLLVALIVATGVGAYLAKRPVPVAVQDPEAAIPLQLSGGASPSLISANHEAVALFRKQNYEEAQKILQTLVQQNPGFSGLYVNLAAVQMKRGDLRKARKNLEQALKLDSKNATALNNLGTLNLTSKKWVAAQESFRQSLETNPSLEDTRLNYAKSLELGGKTADAIREYETYIAHVGTDPIFGNLLRKRVLKLKSMLEYMKKNTEAL